MVLNKRQEQTVELVKAEQRASVKRIAQHFFVSEMTVRRDLKILEENGYLKRYNGGAVYNKEFDHLPIESRKLLNTAEKRKLCELARRYLRDNCSVFIDSSSTCLNLVPMLADFKGITLITNSVQCLLAAEKHHLKCILAGGNYHEYDRCTVGVETVEFVRRFNVDVAFFPPAVFRTMELLATRTHRRPPCGGLYCQTAKKPLFCWSAPSSTKSCRTPFAER